MANVNDTSKSQRFARAQRLVRRTHRRLRDIALWRAFWPVIIVVSVFLLVALLGFFEYAPKAVAAMASLIVIVGLLIGGFRGIRRLVLPTLSDAQTALDAQSEFRPLSALQDRPIVSNPRTMALWHQHEGRLLSELRHLSVPRFAKVWRRVDPFYLRAILPLALLLAIGFNWGQLHSRLAPALIPDYGSLFGAERVAVEAWITPPDYTGRAPIFLKPEMRVPQVPEGSVITLRASAPMAPQLKLESQSYARTQRFAKTPDGAFETTATLRGTTDVSVHWWGERYAWQIAALPDAPPTVKFVADPEHTPTDRTEFSWTASDDYGVARVELSIRPLGRGVEPDLVEIDYSGRGRSEIEASSTLDLSRNRWAGARVEVRLIATDGAGQTGQSEPFVFILPNRLMIIPLAKAIQDARLTLVRDDGAYQTAPVAEDVLRQGALNVSATQRFNLAPAGVQRSATMLEAITYDAPRHIKDVLLYAGLESARYTLASATSKAEARSAEPLLWALALRAEYGTAADAYAALMAAKEALEDALRDGASEAEIRRLMEAFKDAAQRYVAAKMAEAMGNIQSAPDNRDSADGPGGSSMGGNTFSDMLDALEDLTETGASDQARQLLADITNMLENLQFQQGSGSGEGFPGMPGEQNAESDDNIPQEERELSETMQELLDLLREQRQLNDETLAQQRGETGEPRDGQSPEQNGDGEGNRPFGEVDDNPSGPDGLAERQRELAERLGELRDDTEDGVGAGDLMDEDVLRAIERAQRRAGNAIEDEDERRALRNQEQATRQLRDLAEGLAEALDTLQEARRGEGQPPGQQASDPFGNQATSGIDDRNSVEIPDQLERDRARAILEELRRRYGDAEDEDEREYLDRLLDRF